MHLTALLSILPLAATIAASPSIVPSKAAVPTTTNTAAFASAPSTARWHHAAPPIDVDAPFTETPHFSYAQLYNLSTTFFDAFMSPNNAVEAKKINSTFFADNVIGRVDVTRDFLGRELNTEYAFGLFANILTNPNSFTLLGIPQNYNITHFTANGNIAAVNLIVQFDILKLQIKTPVEIIFWVTFNSRGQISQYDATFRFLDWQFKYLAQIGMDLFKVNNATAFYNLVQLELANSVCDTAMASCNGTLQQYESRDQCMDFLTKDTELGEAWQLGWDTVFCRMVHQNMVAYRPEVHCAHIGPSGGGYCTNDRNYTGVVTETLFKNSPMVAYGYQNADKDVAEM